MPPASYTNIDKIRNDVTELQKSMAQISLLVEKMDITIEKLTDLSSTVTTLLAVHEQRLVYNEQTKDSINDLLNKNRIETTDKIKDIYTILEKKNEDLSHKLEVFSEKIDKSVNGMQKYIWIATGAAAIIAWVLEYGFAALNLATKLH